MLSCTRDLKKNLTKLSSNNSLHKGSLFRSRITIKSVYSKYKKFDTFNIHFQIIVDTKYNYSENDQTELEKHCLLESSRNL